MSHPIPAAPVPLAAVKASLAWAIEGVQVRLETLRELRTEHMAAHRAIVQDRVDAWVPDLTEKSQAQVFATLPTLDTPSLRLAYAKRKVLGFVTTPAYRSALAEVRTCVAAGLTQAPIQEPALASRLGDLAQVIQDLIQERREWQGWRLDLLALESGFEGLSGGIEVPQSLMPREWFEDLALDVHEDDRHDRHAEVWVDALRNQGIMQDGGLWHWVNAGDAPASSAWGSGQNYVRTVAVDD